MGIKLPKEIPADQVPLFNALTRRLTKFSEAAAPEVFRWLGWAAAVAAVQYAALKIDSHLLRLIPWALFLLLVARIQWAIGGLAKEEEEGKPVRVKWNRWQTIAALASWLLAYQIAFTIPSAIVEADLLKFREGSQQAPSEVVRPSGATQTPRQTPSDPPKDTQAP